MESKCWLISLLSASSFYHKSPALFPPSEGVLRFAKHMLFATNCGYDEAPTISQLSIYPLQDTRTISVNRQTFKTNSRKRTDREAGKTYILKGVVYSIHEASVYIRISGLETGYTVIFEMNVLSYFQGLAYKEIILFGLFPRTHPSKLHFVLDTN